jgi:hypothetical protein
VAEKTVFEMIGEKMCPTCHTVSDGVKVDYVACKVCGSRGVVKDMKWCLKVPVFNPISDTTNFSGQLYEDARGGHWKMMGYAHGCGREVTEGYCTSCRLFNPAPVDHAVHRSRAKPARAFVGKDAAGGRDD